MAQLTQQLQGIFKKDMREVLAEHNNKLEKRMFDTMRISEVVSQLPPSERLSTPTQSHSRPPFPVSLQAAHRATQRRAGQRQMCLSRMVVPGQQPSLAWESQGAQQGVRHQQKQRGRLPTWGFGEQMMTVSQREQAQFPSSWNRAVDGAGAAAAERSQAVSG